jgi:hypothetical protein
MTRTIRTSIARALVALVAVLPAAVSGQQQGRSTRPSAPAALGIHGFSVVLVVGSLQAAGATAATSEAVPEAAKKALADMKDFLPYKRYQLLDAAWMLCCAGSRAGVSGRIRGPDERDYRYEVDPIGVSETKLNVRFTIREMMEPVIGKPGQGKMSDSARLEHSRQLHEAIREAGQAEIRERSTRQKFEVGMVTPADMEAATLSARRAVQRIEELRRLSGSGSAQGQGTSGQNIIDSTFSITPGETVVVGTSRLNGDRALIAILTAAAKPAATPRERVPNP